jgi:hypothetical protein
MKRRRKKKLLNKWDIWTAPALLGVLTCVGLVSALLADGAGDWISWIALSIPVATVIAFAAAACPSCGSHGARDQTSTRSRPSTPD